MATMLSTTEAARRMGVSVRTVRELCSQDRLPGASRTRANGPWLIPEDSVEAWLEHHGRATGDNAAPAGGQEFAAIPPADPPTAPRSSPDTDRFFRHFIGDRVVRRLLAISAVLSALTVIGGFIISSADVAARVAAYFAPPAIAPAAPDETLILIATFRRTEGVIDTEPQNEIRRAIVAQVEELGLEDIRVAVEPTIIDAEDRETAERIGQQYNASIVVWGSNTGVRLSVNYLNRKLPDFEAAEVEISETSRTQLANPDAYATFITRDLPSQVTFLSLFAIGESYYRNETYGDAARIVERAIASLASEEPLEGVAEAYFRLGWLYQLPLADEERALAAYTRAIELQPRALNAYFNRGVLHYDRGEYEAAVEDYSAALDIDPDYGEAYANRGNAYRQQGQYEAALADYEAALATLAPDNQSIVYHSRGYLYETIGELEKSLADYNEALRLEPDAVDSLHNRADVLMQMGELDQALAGFNRVIELDPDYAAAYDARGLVYYYQGDTEAALTEFDRAIALDPTASFLVNRGVVLMKQGESEAALEDFERAIALDPDLALAYFNRGSLLGGQGDYEAALEDFNRAIALEPGVARYYATRALIHDLLGDQEAVLADYDSAVEAAPDDPDTYYKRGDYYYLHLNDLDAALEDFNKVLQLDADHVNALVARGNVLEDLEEYDRALEDLNRAVALQPDAITYQNRGDLYFAMGDLDAALQDYERALGLSPDTASLHFNRGLILYSQGELETALAGFDRVVELDPSDAGAYFWRASIRLRQGQPSGEWAADLERVLELIPGDPRALNLLCWGYALDQRSEQALPYCEEAVENASPDDRASYRDSRGIVYAQLDRRDAAIADFEAFITWAEGLGGAGDDLAAMIERRRGWVASLEAGENPFTAEVLAELRVE